MNVIGIIFVVLFYCLILMVGLWTGKKKHTGNSEADVLLAGRNIGIFVGISTMIATWVGRGGYIDGTAEAIYRSGLLWCLIPISYSLSLVFGGIFFAGPMRRRRFVTMLDPLQDCFGEHMGGLLCLPALCGEVFWSTGIFSALGDTLSVIIELDRFTSIILSCCISVFYTIFGGFTSVVYSDVIQLFALFIGLWLSVPYALQNEKVDFQKPDLDLIGEIEGKYLLRYIDCALLLMFGGIPWQIYFQRVLSSKSASQAQTLSYVAALGCFIMAIPLAIIGIAARATEPPPQLPHTPCRQSISLMAVPISLLIAVCSFRFYAWTEIEYTEPLPITQNEISTVLPMIMQYLTPEWVSFFALGAIFAVIMSSADSSILSASSMFARNIYRKLLRQNASETEIVWVMRLSMVVFAFSATTMAIAIPSTCIRLSMLFADLVYVILFPQLIMAVHFKRYCNTYGSLAAYIVGFSIRVACGEPQLGLETLIQFPGWDGESQYFPFRTTAMLCSLLTLVSVSWATKKLFHNGTLAPHYDWIRCEVNKPENAIIVGEPHEGEQMTTLTSGPIGVQYCAAIFTSLVDNDEPKERINQAQDINDDDPNTMAAPLMTSTAPQRKPSIVEKMYKPGYEPMTGC